MKRAVRRFFLGIGLLSLLAIPLTFLICNIANNSSVNNYKNSLNTVNNASKNKANYSIDNKSNKIEDNVDFNKYITNELNSIRMNSDLITKV